jgi:hypothetical protein
MQLLPFFEFPLFFQSSSVLPGGKHVTGDQLAGQNGGPAGRNAGEPAGGRQ